MIQRRAEDARRRAGVFAACLDALDRGEEGIDRTVALTVIAEIGLAIRATLVK